MKKFAAVLLAVLVLAGVSAAYAAESENLSEEYSKGIALEQEHKFSQARKVYEIGLKKEDPWCMYRYAMFCFEGRGGVKKNNAAGIKLLKKAAKLNQPDANFWLGEFYIEGKYDLKKNPEKGAQLMRKAVELGHIDALSWLGFFTLRGMYGVEKDAEKGLELMNRAIDNGIDTAALILGVFYEDGIEFEQNFATAVEYYTKAAQLGNKKAEAKIYNLMHLPNLVFGCPCPASEDELNGVYSYDELNTNADFKGKTAHASGIVLKTGKDDEGNAYVMILGPKRTYRNVVCRFDEDSSEEVADLKKEDILRVRGEFEGVKNGNVVIRHCKVIAL